MGCVPGEVVDSLPSPETFFGFEVLTFNVFKLFLLITIPAK
nr:MAG TPA: hypothetical protein [Caudoviricetes sp.]